jgi:peptide/nickel transport system substrate-binding protein
LLLAFTFSPVSEVTVVDPLTVVVTIKQPWAAFPAYLFSAGRTGIVAPAQLNDTEDCETNLIGSGPFKLQSFDPSTGEVVVKRNPNYWRKGYPLLNKITFKVQGNSIQRLNGIQGGQFDVIHIPSGKSGKAAKSFANVNVIKSAKGFRDINNVLFNTARPPFDDPTAREALARGIDRNILNVLANQGLGDVANQVVDSKVMGASKNSGFPKFDIKKAKQLVSAYKAKNGGEFKFDLQTTFDTGVQDVAAEIKRQARKLGITVNLPAPIDEAQIVNSALAGKTDAFLWRNYPGSDPDTLYVWFHSGSIVNFGNLEDPVIDAGFEQGRVETDPAKRTAIYTKLFRHMSSTTSALWFGYSDWYIASRSNIKGIIGPNLPNASGKPGKEKPSQVVAGFHQLLGISKG